MKKQLFQRFALAAAFVLAFSFAAPLSVFAQGGEDDSNSSTSSGSGSGDGENEQEQEDASDDSTDDNEDRQRGDDLKSKIQELKQEREERKQERLDAAKLKVCEKRQEKIAAIMTRSIARAEKQIALFEKITERVKTFYANKGLTVANYNELVAAIDSAKADAQANLETLKGLGAFACDADDPKGNVEAFKVAVASVREDLKAYRTTVKNLIVAVKSAQSAADNSEGEE